MAAPEPLAILKQGVVAWNEWRAKTSLPGGDEQDWRDTHLAFAVGIAHCAIPGLDPANPTLPGLLSRVKHAHLRNHSLVDLSNSDLSGVKLGELGVRQ